MWKVTSKTNKEFFQKQRKVSFCRYIGQEFTKSLGSVCVIQTKSEASDKIISKTDAIKS